jgi:hypothetical protein
LSIGDECSIRIGGQRPVVGGQALTRNNSSAFDAGNEPPEKMGLSTQRRTPTAGHYPKKVLAVL